MENKITEEQIIDRFWENTPESQRVYSSVLISECMKSYASLQCAELKNRIDSLEDTLEDKQILLDAAQKGCELREKRLQEIEAENESLKKLLAEAVDLYQTTEGAAGNHWLVQALKALNPSTKV